MHVTERRGTGLARTGVSSGLPQQLQQHCGLLAVREPAFATARRAPTTSGRKSLRRSRRAESRPWASPPPGFSVNASAATAAGHDGGRRQRAHAPQPPRSPANSPPRRAGPPSPTGERSGRPRPTRRAPRRPTPDCRCAAASTSRSRAFHGAEQLADVHIGKPPWPPVLPKAVRRLRCRVPLPCQGLPYRRRQPVRGVRCRTLPDHAHRPWCRLHHVLGPDGKEFLVVQAGRLRAGAVQRPPLPPARSRPVRCAVLAALPRARSPSCLPLEIPRPVVGANDPGIPSLHVIRSVGTVERVKVRGVGVGAAGPPAESLASLSAVWSRTGNPGQK